MRIENRYFQKQNLGFSLIEIMIVISVIAILVVSISTQVKENISQAKENVLKEQEKRLNSAIKQYFADFQRHPRTLDELISKKYMKELPDNPFTLKKEYMVYYKNVKTNEKFWQKYDPNLKNYRILEAKFIQ